MPPSPNHRDSKTLAETWIADWNSRDLARILTHYAEDVVFVSPASTRITGDPSGRVVGKPALAAYWGEALRRSPALHFTLLGAFSGPDGLAIRYRSSRTGGEVVEVLRFGADGLAAEAWAYYE